MAPISRVSRVEYSCNANSIAVPKKKIMKFLGMTLEPDRCAIYSWNETGAHGLSGNGSFIFMIYSNRLVNRFANKI